MMTKTDQLLPLALLAVLSACGGSSEDAATVESPVPPAEPAQAAEDSVDMTRSESYADARAAAQAALEEAMALEYAWSTSPQLLQAAEEANAAGDEEKAIELADEARIQADLAILQAKREAVAWKDNIIGDQGEP